ncbi:HlyD family type I secretion periplasmic adaptor subunit [Azoarcus communis]|uniref:Membrane fusion protein (MFP) family protein n=1 Tax=Parazoarcus communis SWub3 = DSM 12120 TaxID=1121029 RepID=A0A323V0I2_9RHOO|nr:HlyD family type I secretion periplasmic adaptor subunit [Parazoarcus communis]NMG47786.1 HlyD family type I secretion periplasmic adaptor subunit [Parazoarcus communis]NMG69542.1 HlyD family type I secretion periplasmic adaptor subunit [Parazoarcus communis SWub3 = DSM 12120]PZA17480.1 HlyD family type I secretion periplasmic adaptor subunit [Azoarcus communis] [Parazoarcus communis SWub3 = DSM 12120]
MKSLAQYSHVSHIDFHPPLIRLQHTAPHPQGLWVLWTLLGLLAFLLVWSLVGRLDIVAVADGKLVSASYLKIVQPPEAGIINEILVREGERVRAGQILMRMDALVTSADLEAINTEYDRKRLVLARIDAELGGMPFAPDMLVSAALVRETGAQYQANLNALAATLAEERSRLLRAQQELAAARQQKERLEAVLPHYREQDRAYQRLVAEGFAGGLMGSDKRRERIEKEQELVTQGHLIAAAHASIDQSQKRLEQIEADHIRQLHAERHEVQAQIDKLAKEKEKQLHRRQLLELKAPQDGVIKDLATHTAGTVVQPGTVLASLVPSDESLKAEVWISNEDIGFVREGQTVKLKFAPYSFQKYGMGQGTVEHVSADAQSEDEARDKGLYGAGQRPLRYKALVAVDASGLEVEGVKYGLSVGMQTTAEILLGNRTVAEYLLSPVKKAWHEAGRER